MSVSQILDGVIIECVASGPIDGREFNGKPFRTLAGQVTALEAQAGETTVYIGGARCHMSYTHVAEAQIEGHRCQFYIYAV